METYTIKQGDTLRGIARQFYNDPDKYTFIVDNNHFINDPNYLEEGWIITVPNVDNPNGAGFFLNLRTYHSGFPGGIRWRLTTEGLDLEGSGIERSGNPATVTKIWENYAPTINKWAEYYDIPSVLIVATIATESHGSPKALRIESGYLSDVATPQRISAGLMQTLLSVTRSTLRNVTLNHTWLFKPNNSVQAGASYIAEQRYLTHLDPPKVCCAYHTGGLYYDHDADNRWKVQQIRGHCDRFIRWFNDAVQVLADHPLSPSIPYERYFD